VSWDPWKKKKRPSDRAGKTKTPTKEEEKEEIKRYTQWKLRPESFIPGSPKKGGKARGKEAEKIN